MEVQRSAGLNDVGMVAWIITLRTPEYPEGRQAILIANDITYQVCRCCYMFCPGDSSKAGFGLYLDNTSMLLFVEEHLGQLGSVLGGQLIT